MRRIMGLRYVRLAENDVMKGIDENPKGRKQGPLVYGVIRCQQLEGVRSQESGVRASRIA